MTSDEMNLRPEGAVNPEDLEQNSLENSSRRQLMKLASLAGIAGISLTDLPLQALSQAPPPNAPLVTSPMQSNLISKNETVTADGKETSLIFETTGSNGVKSISKAFIKRVELGNSYKVFSTFGVSWYPKGSSDKEPTEWVSLHSSIIDGIKGDVDGDYRKDTIRSTTIYGDGTVSQSAETVVRVLVNTQPLEEMSFQDLTNYVSNHIKQARSNKIQ